MTEISAVVEYKNISNKINFNKSYTFGEIQTKILSNFHICVYDIEYIYMLKDNDTIILGSELYDFHMAIHNFEIIINNYNFEYIFRVKEREKKTDKYINAYTKYLQEKNDEEYAKSLIQEEHKYLRFYQDYNDRKNNTQRQFSNIESDDFDDNIEIGISMTGLENNYTNRPFRQINNMLNFIRILSAFSDIANEIDTSIDGFIRTPENVKVVMDKKEFKNILSIPYKQYKNSNNNIISNCVICLDEFNDNTIVTILPNCKHCYHHECIKKWLTENNNKCPICKIAVGKKVITI